MAAFRELDVFINTPFDGKYQAMFDAIVFAVVRSGFKVRCALEVDNSADNRLGKIYDIIAECKFGIHDISRTEADGSPPLPRFNMPFELGLFLGAKRFGTGKQKTKACIVLDREPHRYKRLMSDLAGVDIHSHAGKPKQAVQEIVAWLRSLPGASKPGGGAHIWAEYQAFVAKMKLICASNNIKVTELTFPDYNGLVADHVATLR